MRLRKGIESNPLGEAQKAAHTKGCLPAGRRASIPWCFSPRSYTELRIYNSECRISPSLFSNIYFLKFYKKISGL
ncbi:MAG: hypothetical protein A2172_00810 [Candidatus Woykebacteria bacterium RBG_13_40_15]|uniref:Uncharacterized protein n=1 Tax=Candidatus Woykebacteria bacterium RBG_13_40_15 TaxID=1802593 RepID=A0A1G1W8X9_9BACT|nr:MAG: hypothetical protein A2172_00810 [Candidatus Woykebacteria bacterium RBG_13_40_15]